MPSIEIYYMSLSPFCRAVEMVANMASVSLNKHHLKLLEKEHMKEDSIPKYHEINDEPLKNFKKFIQEMMAKKTTTKV